MTYECLAIIHLYGYYINIYINLLALLTCIVKRANITMGSTCNLH